MRTGIIVAIGGLALLAGCGHSADKAASTPAQPKWKGAPYRLAFDTKAAKPSTAGVVVIPPVKYTANPEALETRAIVVVKFDVPAEAHKGQPISSHMIGTPVDISGAEGTLPADYMDRVSKGLNSYFGTYCVDGKVNVSVALARSSLNSQASDEEVEDKRLSDWLPTDVTIKKPHGKC